ncbi:hypothetical protein FGB62_149g024 [Gracilaria domingensis]|nr:hypothetical protein FGB62_149g024 [Gracilaria domingensis]
MELVKRKRERQSAEKQKKRVADASRVAASIGKKTAIVARENLSECNHGLKKVAKARVRTYQFVAFLVAELIDIAVDARLGDSG